MCTANSFISRKKELGIGFCSGKKITWDELYADIDVKRFGYNNFYKKIAENVKRGDTLLDISSIVLAVAVLLLPDVWHMI